MNFSPAIRWFVFLLVFVCYSPESKAQRLELEWAAQVRSMGDWERGTIHGGAKAHPDGGVVVAGFFRDSTDFDPSDTAELWLVPPFWKSYVLWRLNAAGELLWVKDFSAFSGYRTAYNGLDVGPQGGIFVGHFNGVHKLDANGDSVWAAMVLPTGFSNFHVQMIRVNDLGETYLWGHLDGTIQVPTPQGLETFTALNTHDALLAKVDAQGNFLWAKQFETDSEGNGWYLALDNQSNVFCSGDFENWIDVDPDTSTQHLLTASHSEDSYIVKLNSDGVFQWVQHLATPQWAEAYPFHLETDHDGAVYSAIFINDSLDLITAGNSSVFYEQDGFPLLLEKLSSGGQLEWAKFQWGLTGVPGRSGIAITAQKAIWTTGRLYPFTGTSLDVDLGPDTFLVDLDGTSSPFFNQLDSNGNYIESMMLYGPDQDREHFWNITLSGDTAVYITAILGDSCDLDPGPGMNPVSTLDDQDVFVLKYIVCPAFDNELSFSNGTITTSETSGSFQWLDCDQGLTPIPNATASSFQAPADGSFAVVVTRGGCSDTSECFVVNPSGLSSLESETGWHWYPNPSEGQVMLVFENSEPRAQIEVINALGQVVWRQEVRSQTVVPIDLTGFTGLHWIRVDGRVDRNPLVLIGR